MNEDKKREEKYLNASTKQLIWWRYKKHVVAMIGLWVIGTLYAAAIFCGFLAPYNMAKRHFDSIYSPPTKIHIVDDEGRLRRPFVRAVNLDIDMITQELRYDEVPGTYYPIRFFLRGDTYSFWGLWNTNLHLFGVDKPANLFVFGTDRMGRDMFSRCLYGSRISLSIGMLGVFLSLVLGLVLGGISGYVGGWMDGVIQRMIEIIRCFPSIPLWMGLSASMPPHWAALKVYFAITVILSLIGWTDLARMVRGKLISLREEEFVLAARFAGAGHARIIFRHLLPSFTSHIIVTVTLAIPSMILAETALSFLGVGLRPPITSLGVLLKEAQNITTIALYPWLLIPVVFVIGIVLAFNFVGDGLRGRGGPVLEVIDMMPVLAVENLRVHFFLDEGVVRAVDGVSFSVEPAKTLGIVGESGSGKSVIGQSILRIVPPPGRIVEGKILLRVDNGGGGSEQLELTSLDPRGRQARGMRGREIAMIFQEPMNSFSPVHTVGSQIIEALMLHADVSGNEARNRAIEMLGRVGIPQPEHRINAYPHELSGGMRQRAMIAMALVCKPRVLIADEPTTALDVTIQAQILELLKSLQEEFGMAILFISHNLGVISDISHDVLVVYFGRVMERAPVEVLFEHPLHPYTQALLKSIPGIDTPVRSHLATIEGTLPDPHTQVRGCPFFWRCTRCEGNTDCRDNEYQLVEVADRHFLACSHLCSTT